MTDLGTRIFRLVQAWGAEGMEAIEKQLKEGGPVEEVLSDFEKTQGFNEPQAKPTKTWPKDLTEDLAVFGLTPPATIEQVKGLRNKELKKYHPDRFNFEPEKLETAKQIVQILNQAYERLENHPQMR